MSQGWEKAGVIFGGIGAVAVIAAVIAAFVVPEVRCFFGLKSEVCPNSSWKEVGENVDRFVSCVGWLGKSYNNLTFDLRAPLGNLPTDSLRG